MTVLSAIVQTLVLTVIETWRDLSFGSAAGAQLVRDDPFRCAFGFLEQSLQQPGDSTA